MVRKSKRVILMEKVLEASVGHDWDEVRQNEWMVRGCDQSMHETCVCTKTDLVHTYTIVNVKNGNQLHPIGSRCIKYFQNEIMDDDAKILSWGYLKFKYGKYEGKTFKEVYESNPGYLKYLAENRNASRSVHKNKHYDKAVQYYLKRNSSLTL